MNATAPSPIPLPVHLSFRHGQLRGGPWPAHAPLPFGCDWSPGRGAPWFEAPACLHAAVRRAAARAGALLADELPPPPPLPLPVQVPALPPPLALAFANYRASGRRGIVLGAGDIERTVLATAAIAHGGRAALLLAPTEAGVDGWIEALRPTFGGAVGRLCLNAPPPAVAVAAVMPFFVLGERWGNRFRVVVADGCDRVPQQVLQHGLACCTATQRLGFVGTAAPAGRLLELGRRLGPLLHACMPDRVPRQVLHLPLRPQERAEYDLGWGAFLAAFDRFTAMADGARFHDFVRWARQDEQGRPGLLGWHRALRALRWTRAKAAACAQLLQQHRRQRLLFFTQDRESAYALCRSCHALPITAELPAAARRQALQAWADGAVPALCGPRLLEEAHDLPPADVGVVVGAAFGRTQLEARLRRVQPDGAFYQLVTADTVEVGRLWRDAVA